MEANVQMTNLLQTMKRLEQKVDFIENEVVTIKSYLDEDSKLTAEEKEITESAIARVKSGTMGDTISLENLRKKVGA
jgi:hypothetical protein